MRRNPSDARRGAPPARAGGFTVAEVLVVVALAALLAALALPWWGRAAARQRTAMAASEARDMLGAVQALAMHDPHPPDDPPSPPETEPRYEYRVELVEGELRTVRQVELVDLATGLETPRDPPEVLRRLALPGEVTARTEPAGPLVFDRYGRAQADGALVLEGAGRRHRLVLRSGQPDVRMEEGWL